MAFGENSMEGGGGGEGALQTIVIATAVLQCKIMQMKTNCALLLNDIKAVEDECNYKRKKTEEIKVEIVKLEHRKQTLQESIDSMDQSKQTLEIVRGDLRKQLQLEKIKTADQRREHATTLRHYGEMWQSYLEKYRTFPMAKEVEQAQVQLKQIKINLAVMKQAFAVEKQKIRQLEEIRRKRKHIAGVKSAEAYFKFLDTVNHLERCLEQKKCKSDAIECLKTEKSRVLENIAENTQRVSLMAKERAQKRAEFGHLSYVRVGTSEANNANPQITRVPPLQLVQPLMNKLPSSVDFNSYTDTINFRLSNRMRMACTPPKRVVTVTGVVRRAEANKSMPMSQGVSTGQTASEAAMHSTRNQLTPAVAAYNPPRETVQAGGFCAVQNRSTVQQERPDNACYLPAESIQEICIDNEMEMDCIVTHDGTVPDNHANEFCSGSPEMAGQQPESQKTQTMNVVDRYSSGMYIHNKGLPIKSQYFSKVSSVASHTNSTPSVSTTIKSQNTRQSRLFPIQTTAMQQSMNSKNRSETAPVQAGSASQSSASRQTCSGQNQSQTVTMQSHNVPVLSHNVPLESHNKVPMQTAVKHVSQIQSQITPMQMGNTQIQLHTTTTQAATVPPETYLMDVYDETTPASYCNPSEEGNEDRYIPTFTSPAYSFTGDTAACSGYSSPPNPLSPNQGIGSSFGFNFGPTQNQASGPSFFSGRSAPNAPESQQSTFVGFGQQSFAGKPSKNSIFSLF